MYFILEVMFLIPLRGNSQGVQLATILAVVFSISTEFIQHYFIVNRYGEVMDFVANLSGIVVGYTFLKKRINI